LRLDMPVKFLKGIGERRADLLGRLGIHTADALLAQPGAGASRVLRFVSLL
jgi:hypothetical protein